MSSLPLNCPSRGTAIFATRTLAAVGSSAMFGLVATSTAQGIALLPAVLAGFLFGTVFVGGTGYRIIRSAWSSVHVASPASWSGAAAASAIACLIAMLVWPRTMDGAARLLLGYGLAINFAYLAVKVSCALAGCCHADVRLLGRVFGLRQVEIGATSAILMSAAILSLVDLWLGALVALVGHTLLRLYSRGKRVRWSTGWPPLRQPGAELAPLQMLSVFGAVGALLG